MAQFDANVNLRVNVQEANKQLNKVERRLRQLERGTISSNKRNQGLASNLITGSKAAGANVGARIARQNLDAQKKALRVADARVEKEIRLAAALQRQETILKALTRAGGTNSKEAQDRVDAAIKASKEAKTNLGIQQAVNTLLEKELQIRREINRVENASNEAKSVGNRRGREIQGFGLPAAQEKKLLKLNAEYVRAAEKGQADIAKAINRKVETELKGIRKAQAAEKKRIEKKRRDDLKAIKDAEKAEEKRQKKLDNLIGNQSKKKKKGGAGGSGLANNLLAALGFPLLFGGGLGSVAGGAVGALGGSALGAGFGASILGSALGQQLDNLATAADKTAQALRNPIDNLDDLVSSLGIAGTALEKQIQTADKLGLSATAALVAQQEFENKFGSDTAKVFEDLGKDFTNFNNDLAALGIAIQKLLAGPLGGLLRAAGAVARSFSGNVEVQSLRANLSAKDRQAFDEELGGSGFKSPEAVNALIEKYSAKLQDVKDTSTDIKDVNTAISDEYARQQQLLERQTAVVVGQLVNRRDVQAALEGSVAVLAEQNKLEKINTELAAARALKETETTKEKIRQLEVDKEQTQEALRRAEAARINAVILAERAIERDTANAFIGASNAFIENSNSFNQLGTLQNGLIANAEKLKKAQQDIFRQEQLILQTKQQQDSVGVNEPKVLRQLVEKQQQERIALANKQKLQEAQLKARVAEAKDRQQAIKDTRQLRTLEAEITAERLKRATDPELMMSFAGAGLGFFANSAKLEADQIAERAAKLELFNEQLAKLQQRLQQGTEEGASKDFLIGLGNQIDDVTALRDAYERLQPGIDAAALAQARFNDAFNAVSPAVNSLVNGLKEVVAGTKTAEQAFADFLNTIANQLVQTAAVMIAQYIAIGIARAFAGIPSNGVNTSFNGGTFNPANFVSGSGVNTGNVGGITSLKEVIPVRGFFNPDGFRAAGGSVSAGSPYIVGESGSELFIPNVSGRVIPNDDYEAARAVLNQNVNGEGAVSEQEAMADSRNYVTNNSYSSSQAFSESQAALATSTSSTERIFDKQMLERQFSNPAPIRLDVETTVINGIEYLTVEQGEAMTAAAVQQAKGQVFSDLKNRPAARRQVGMR